MPLIHSSSPKAFKQNVSTLMHDVGKSPHVQSRAQALAIAYETKRRGHAAGGVANYDLGGSVASDPVQQVISALSAGANASGGGTATIGSTNPSAPSSVPQTAAAMTATGGVAPQAPVAANTSTSTPTTTAVPSVASPPLVPTQGVAPVGSNPATMTQSPTPPIANKLMALGGGLMSGEQFPSLKPPSAPSWNERQVAKMHSGPLLGASPGRADTRYTKVASGSYVLPASTISSMGHGNSVAGLATAHKMFGSGPYGTSAGNITHGSGAPRPPAPFHQSVSPALHLPKVGIANSGMTSEGGARGHGEHEPVDVALSDGEFVIEPREILRRWGSLRNGHAVLDAFVMANRKKEIQTLKHLPPPAKK